MIPALPEPIVSVKIPTAFPVSALATHSECRLRLVTNTKEWRSFQLTSGPEAAIGSFIHAVLERAGQVDESASSIFESELHSIGEQLLKDPARSHFADLVKTRSFMEWRNIRAGVLAKCENLRSPRTVSSTGARRPAAWPRFTGPEVTLADGTLRLIGRSDRIQRTGPNSYTITDFKTGKIFDAEGMLLSSIRFQLELYALLAEARYPSCAISLKVESGTEGFDVPWGVDQRQQAKERLMRIMDNVPAGVTVAAETLSKPTDECRVCAMRHYCADYIRIAPSWWKEIPADVGSIASDTWGKITSHETVGTSVNVELNDAAGRRVKVRGLRMRPGLSDLKVGAEIYIFALERTGSGRGWNGRPFQPHAFHEIGADPQSRSAWTTAVFLGRVS
jgi:RecB family exonuclease